jgi:uncharacterized RDD family membrane protein YckC
MPRDCAADRVEQQCGSIRLAIPRRQLGMHCPSCGAISDSHDCCADVNAESTQTLELAEAVISTPQANMNSASDSATQPQPRRSTLIEFPGVNRTPMPEWRKELSERVREVQERKARDAARDSEELKSQKLECDSQPQLELLPAAEIPAMNPLVAAALKRIERAHQTSASDPNQHRNILATAVAYAPALEENEPEVLPALISPPLVLEPEVEAQLSSEPEPLPQIEKTHNLVVVTAAENPKPEPETSKATPKRLIVDDPNDPALNYLDSISRNICVDELDSRRPGVFRRLVCGLLDLAVCGLLAAPIGLAMRMTGTDLRDPRAIEVLAGSLLVVAFLYLTLTVALTGRTFAMRLLSLRVIDIKTGLIPTGGQSVGRSFLYLLSLAFAGLGILAALVSREGYAAHDRFTRTAVIRT